MATVVRFIGDGQTTVTDINSNSVLLRRNEIATLADATWSGYVAQYKALFEVVSDGNNAAAVTASAMSFAIVF